MLVSTIGLFKVLYPSMSEKNITLLSQAVKVKQIFIYLFIMLLTLGDLGEC